MSKKSFVGDVSRYVYDCVARCDDCGATGPTRGRAGERACAECVPEQWCQHADAQQPAHTCPYQSEVNEDRLFQCGCCEPCRKQCWGAV